MLILFLVSLLYFFVLLRASRLFKAAESFPSFGQEHEIFVSIIVPYRNEKENLPALAEDLLTQNYPTELYEIIFVDDHSEDGGGDRLRETLTGADLPRITFLKAEGSGKKAALAAGIRAAKGELIVTHDADCRIGRQLIRNFAATFAQTGAVLLAGPVVYAKPENFLQELFRIEFASAIGLTAVSFAAGRPLMCNGANLAFSKAAFLAVDGYKGNEHIASGDDEFLLRKMNRVFPGRLVYLQNSESIAVTAAPKNMSEFFSQRIRWAGKWNADRRSAAFLIAPLFFAFNFAFFPAFFFSLISPETGFVLFLPALIAKIAAEFVFLSPILRFLTGKSRAHQLLLASCMYPFYVCLLVILVFSRKNYDWKGRNYREGKK